MSPFKKRMQELNVTVVDESGAAAVAAEFNNNMQDKSFEKRGNTAYGAFADLNISDIRPKDYHIQKTQYRQHILQAREQIRDSIYSTNRASITGVSVMSALKPRLNQSMDRSNIYSMKSGTSQGQRRKHSAKPTEIENERLGITKHNKFLEIDNPQNVLIPLTPQEQFESICSKKVVEKMRKAIASQQNPVPKNEISMPNAPVELTMQNESEIHKNEEESKSEGNKNMWPDMDKFLDALIGNKPEAVTKFMYFNLKGDKNNPYDLEITDFANRCVERHFTISLKGVARYDNDVATEMVPLKEWLIERELYRGIKSMPFFTNFHRWKLLNIWRKKIWAGRKKQIIDDLEEKMFYLDPIYREHLLQHQKYMTEIARLRLIEINKGSDTDSLEEFTARQKRKRKDVAMKIKEYSQKSRENIKALIKKSLDKLRNRILLEKSLENDHAVVKTAGKPAGIPVSNQQNKPVSTNPALENIGFPDNMSYGHRAALRRECTRFLRIAYLVDFLALKALGTVYLSTVKEVLSVLTYLDKNATVEINAAKNILRKAATAEPVLLISVKLNTNNQIPKDQIKPIERKPFNDKFNKPKEFDLMCHIELEPEKVEETSNRNFYKKYTSYDIPTLINYWLELSPTKEEFISYVQKCLSEGMKILETFERWSRHDDLLPYASVLEDWDEIVGGDWDIPESNFLIPVNYINKHPVYMNHEDEIKSVISSAYSKCYDFLKLFNKYLNMYWRNKNSDFSLIFHDRALKPIESLQNVLKLFDYQKKSFGEKIPETCNLGMLKINCEQARKALLPIPAHFITEVENLCNDTVKSKLDSVKSWIIGARSMMEFKVNTVDDFVKQRENWNGIADAYQGNKEKVDIVGEIYDTLTSFSIVIKKEDKQRHTETTTEMSQLNQLLSNVSDQQELNMDKYKRKLQDNLVPALQSELDALKKEIEDEVLLTHQENINSVLARLASLQIRFTNCWENCVKYNQYQEKLNLEVTEFTVAENIKKGLKLRQDMWKSLQEWESLTESWTSQQFNTIDAKEIGLKAEEYAQIAQTVDKELPENPISKELKSMVDTFKKIVPIVAALRNDNLKKVHWKIIKELLKSEFETTDPSFTLKALLDLKATNYQDEILQISVQATRENYLECEIAKIDNEWKKCIFAVKQYNNKDVYIIDKIDDVTNILDQSISSINMILSDKYIKPLLSQAENWKQTLLNIQNIVEEWIIFQNNWIYLENIFSSSDLRKQLINEASKFDSVDKFYKQLIQKTIKTSNLIKLIKSIKENLLDQFEHFNKMMDEIKKVLLDYLENKRRDFPRFYFLSGEEVLKILSSPEHIQGVQPYLPKLFDSVYQINIHENTDIIGVESIDGENLVFSRSVRIKESIESCLEQIQNSIKETLPKLLKNALSDFDDIEKKEWINKHCVQAVLAISQIVWCNATELTLIEQDTNQNAMIEWYEELVREIQNICEFLKSGQTITNQKKATALMMSEAHLRDIVEELILGNITQPSDYIWQKTLRMYWEEEDIVNQKPANIIVKIMTNKFDYGDEYIGPCERSICTTLSDKVWISISNTLLQHMGIALIGNECTGRCETVKELAKTVGMYCVNTQCSATSGHKFINGIILGVTQQGAWVCINGLEKVPVEVLSVAAKQLSEIKLAYFNELSTIMIDEREIKVQQNCGIFAILPVTNNAKMLMPQNFKANFRAIAMIQPDIKQICETLLLINGFTQALILSEKLVQFIRIIQNIICDETQQQNLESSLRLIKSIIRMAKNVKSQSLIQDETEILRNSVVAIFEPKINPEDFSAFNSVLADIFGLPKTGSGANSPTSTEKPMILSGFGQDEAFINVIENTLDKQKFSKIMLFMQKVLQLNTIFSVYTGAIILGASGCGKTTLSKILKDSLNEYNKTHKKPVKITSQIINQKSMSLSEIFGCSIGQNQEFINGLIPALLRKSSENRESLWLVFDGLVNTEWAEIMNQAISENKIMSVGNGERIQLENDSKIIFETDNLANSAPGIIARCGLLYLPNDTILWQDYVNAFLNKTYGNDLNFMPADLVSHIQFMFEQCVERGISKIRNTCTENIKTTDLQIVANICNLLESLLIPAYFTCDKAEKKKTLTQIFCFSFIWSVSGSLDEASREKVDLLVRSLFENVEMPSNQSVLDFYLDPKRGMSLRPWSEILPTFTINENTEISNLVIPTPELLRQEFLFTHLIAKCKNIFVTGPAGCGKSLLTQNTIDILKSKSLISYTKLNFTYDTQSLKTQQIVEDGLEKKRKDLYGAPINKKVAICIDDFNMPFDNSASELLRSMLDHKGWFDREKHYWKNIEDASLICISKCGNGDISQRFTRHFNILSIPAMNKLNMEYLFKAFLYETFKFKGYSETIQGMAQEITINSIDLFNELNVKLKSQTNHVFTCYNLMKIFKGIYYAPMKLTNSLDGLSKIWVHEFIRTFTDILESPQDKELSNSIICDHAIKLFKTSVNPNIFWTYSKNIADPSQNAVLCQYSPIIELDEYKKILENDLEKYKSQNTGIPQIFLYESAVQFLIKFTRLLNLKEENMIFVLGNSGCGKTALSKFGAFLQGFDIKVLDTHKEITLDYFKSFVKNLLNQAGIQGKQTCFVLNKSQISNDSANILEMLNSLIISGQIPKLYSAEEYDKILSNMLPIVSALKKDESRDSLYSNFVQRIQQNLKIVFICETPTWLKEQISKYSGFVKNANIINVTEWSENDTQFVSKKCLSGLEGCSSEIKNSIIEILKQIHKSVLTKSENQHYKNKNVVIDSSMYMETLRIFGILLTKKRKESVLTSQRILNGLEKLKEAKGKSDSSTEAEFQTKLKELSELFEATQKRINDEQKIANEKEKLVTLQAQEVSNKQKSVKIANDELDAELNMLKPDMNSAIIEVKGYDKKSLMDMKTTNNPTPTMVLVTEAAMMLLQEKTDWSSIKAALIDVNDFIAKLVALPEKIGAVPETLIKKVKASFISNPEFEPESGTVRSACVRPLAKWVKSIVNFYEGYQKSLPRRRKLENERAKLEAANEVLAARTKELNEQRAKIQDIRNEAEIIQNNRQKIAEDISSMKRRSGKVEEFLMLFAEDELRWDKLASEIKQIEENLIGNVLISAAFISYLGQFSHNDRMKFVENWISIIREQGQITVSLDYDFCKFMGKQADFDSWTENGLPKDIGIYENTLIVLNSRKWPMIVDMHGFASKWIKTEFKRNGLTSYKFINKEYIRNLENAMRMGKPILVEEIDEFNDNELNPLLYKNIYEKESEIKAIKIDNKEYEYDENFFLLLIAKTSQNNKSHIKKFNLINFDISQNGLEELLFSELLLQENPDNENQYISQLKQEKELKISIHDTDEKMLRILATAPLETVIDDEGNYDNLKSFKKTVADIQLKLLDQERLINAMSDQREKYKKIATRASIIYECSTEFMKIMPIIRFSLDNFRYIYTKSIEQDKKQEQEKSEIRIKKLLEKVTKKLANFFARGLFRKEREIYVFYLICAIQKSEFDINEKSWKYFLMQQSKIQIEIPNILSKLISDDNWGILFDMDRNLSQFSGIMSSIAMNQGKWENYIKKNESKIPCGFEEKIITEFDKLLLCKIMKNDKLNEEIREYIKKSKLPIYADFNTNFIEDAFLDSRKASPILLIYKNNQIPVKSAVEMIRELAVKYKFNEKLTTFSMGNEQGLLARRIIQTAEVKGEWALIENLNHSGIWLNELESLIEQMKELKTTILDDFRAFITYSGNLDFNELLLKQFTIENSIKVAIENTCGLKEILLQNAQILFTDNKIPSKKPSEFKKILIGLSIFHGIIYECPCFKQKLRFTSDQLISAKLSILSSIEENEEIPWETIYNSVCENIYCGQALFECDRQRIRTIYNEFCIEKVIMNKEYRPFNSKELILPEFEEYNNFIENILNCEIINSEVYGISDALSKQNENIFIETINSIESHSELQKVINLNIENTNKIISELHAKLPPFLDISVFFSKLKL